MTTADLGPAAAKAALRGQVRATRLARRDADREHDAGALAVRALPLLADLEMVACYVSMPAEPGTAALIDLLRQRDIRILLPRVRGSSVEWVEVTGDTPFITSPIGISEPEGSPLTDALIDCDAIVLPALAISCDGTRLGQGGGFYDRALESIPSRTEGGPLRLALVFDDEIFEALPCEPHDSRVDAAITPVRVLNF